jgi:beta-lactamase class A
MIVASALSSHQARGQAFRQHESLKGNHVVLNRGRLLAGAPLLATLPGLVAAAPAPLEAYERLSGGRIGVYAEKVATGAKLTWRASERFVMCSTFKASLAALVLLRVDQGQDSLDRLIPYGIADMQDYAPVAKENLEKGALSVAQMCKAAVELSDNTCANLLLARVGGPAAVTAFWRFIGDEVSRLDHDEPLLNRTPAGRHEDTTTPAAMAVNLRRIVLGDVLSRPSRELFTGWMLNCQTGDKRLRAGLPKGWRIGNKTGNNGKDAAGDIGVVWPPSGGPLLLCVYTRGGTPTVAQFETVFTNIAQLVARQLA